MMGRISMSSTYLRIRSIGLNSDWIQEWHQVFSGESRLWSQNDQGRVKHRSGERQNLAVGSWTPQFGFYSWQFKCRPLNCWGAISYSKVTWPYFSAGQRALLFGKGNYKTLRYCCRGLLVPHIYHQLNMSGVWLRSRSWRTISLRACLE